MEIRQRVRGLKEFQSFLKTVPRGTVKVAVAAFGDWFVGKDDRGLRHYEPYKNVSRKRAYGQTFQSDKQRRWFFANGGPDMIGNNRTGKTKDAWRFRSTNGGYGGTFENDAPGAGWLWSDSGQANQLRKVGHRTISSKIASNMKGAIRHARAAIRALLGR